MLKSIITFLVILFCLFTSCYEPQEGCLNINAENFNIEADEACEDCCELPDLTVAILHRRSFADTTENFRLNTSYNAPANSDQVFQVSNLHFYLSDFQLITDDGNSVSSIDTTEADWVDMNGDTMTTFVESNIAYINRSTNSERNMGSFSPKGVYEKIAFNFGLEGQNTGVVPASISGAHPLRIQNDSLNWNATDGYSFCRIELVKDTSNLDSISIINITQPEVKNIELAGNFELESGFDTRITLRINYFDWFSTVDFRNDSDLTIKEKVLANISGSFSIFSVEQ